MVHDDPLLYVSASEFLESSRRLTPGNCKEKPCTHWYMEEELNVAESLEPDFGVQEELVVESDIVPSAQLKEPVGHQKLGIEVHAVENC